MSSRERGLLGAVRLGQCRCVTTEPCRNCSVRDTVRDTVFHPLAKQVDDEAAIERLTDLRGVGRWTAEYVLLRGLGRLHVFPGDDVGAHNKLRRFFHIDTRLDYDSVKRLVARWHPYAGMVYFHLLIESLSESGVVSDA